MPEAVVDDLEAVQIENISASGSPVRAPPPRLGQSIAKQRAVGRPVRPVVEGQTLDRFPTAPDVPIARSRRRPASSRSSLRSSAS